MLIAKLIRPASARGERAAPATNRRGLGCFASVQGCVLPHARPPCAANQATARRQRRSCCLQTGAIRRTALCHDRRRPHQRQRFPVPGYGLRRHPVIDFRRQIVVRWRHRPGPWIGDRGRAGRGAPGSLVRFRTLRRSGPRHRQLANRCRVAGRVMRRAQLPGPITPMAPETPHRRVGAAEGLSACTGNAAGAW